VLEAVTYIKKQVDVPVLDISHTAAISKRGHARKKQPVYLLCQKFNSNMHTILEHTYVDKEGKTKLKYLAKVQINVS
jgi:hypothetical protein